MVWPPRYRSAHPPVSRPRSRINLRTRLWSLGLWTAFALAIATTASSASAADVNDARKLFQSGKNEACIDLCAEGVADNRWVEGFWVLKMRAETSLGNYPLALKTAEAALEVLPSSIPMRWSAFEVYQAAGKYAEARAELNTIITMAERAPRRLEDCPTRVAVGKAVLFDNGDARQVLETYFD